MAFAIPARLRPLCVQGATFPSLFADSVYRGLLRVLPFEQKAKHTMKSARGAYAMK
jgi:hypothetical protein